MYQAYLSFVKIGALKYFFTSGANVFLCIFHTFIFRSGSNPVQNLHVILLNICEWLGNRCRDAVYSYLYGTTIHFDSKERLGKSVYHVTQCTICSPVVDCIRHKSTQNTDSSPQFLYLRITTANYLICCHIGTLGLSQTLSFVFPRQQDAGKPAYCSTCCQGMPVIVTSSVNISPSLCDHVIPSLSFSIELRRGYVSSKV